MIMRSWACFVLVALLRDCVHTCTLHKLLVTTTYALAHCLPPQGPRASAAPSLIQCHLSALLSPAPPLGPVWVQRRIRWKTQIPVRLLDPPPLSLTHLLLHLWQRHLGLANAKASGGARDHFHPLSSPSCSVYSSKETHQSFLTNLVLLK